MVTQCLTPNCFFVCSWRKELMGDYNTDDHTPKLMFKPYPKFKAYSRHDVTMSDLAWSRLKAAKVKSGLTWTNFILDLLKRKNV